MSDSGRIGSGAVKYSRVKFEVTCGPRQFEARCGPRRPGPAAEHAETLVAVVVPNITLSARASGNLLSDFPTPHAAPQPLTPCRQRAAGSPSIWGLFGVIFFTGCSPQVAVLSFSHAVKSAIQTTFRRFLSA